MKEATGELNMTLITIIAIAGLAGIFALIYPNIKARIENRWNQTDQQLTNMENQ